MSRQELIAAARAPVDAYSAKDWSAARESMAPDYVFEELSTGRTVSGVDDVLEVWKAWGDAFSDSRATVEESLVDGDTVVLRLKWQGTHTGPLALPSGDVAPTGKTVEFKACQITQVEDGKAVATTHYWDLQTMLSQLGIPVTAPAAPMAG
jgi:steroid delta-isomerase-like uncharacterized protein